MGLTITYFYSLTPRQFDNILTGYRNKEEANVKLKYELNRDLEFAIISPYLDDKDPKHPKTILEFKTFPWEEKQIEVETRKPKTKAEQKAYWDVIDASKEKAK